MDSSPTGLMSSPSALFPVSLERAPSSASIDFALSDSSNPDASVSGGNIFVMTDTAHDDDPSVHGARRADPPPDSQQLQQQLTQQLLQQQQTENEYQLQPPAQQGPPPRRSKLYAYGIADPEYMSLPCKMSMKHARVTVNHETNNRLYGKKLPGQVSLFHQTWLGFGVEYYLNWCVAVLGIALLSVKQYMDKAKALRVEGVPIHLQVRV